MAEAKVRLSAEDNSKAAFDSFSRNLEQAHVKAVSLANYAAGGLGLALAGGLAATAASIRASINEMDRLDETAPKIGLTAQRLAEYSYAARMSGASTEVLEKGLSALSVKLSEGSKAFELIGVRTKGSNGDLKETGAVLEELADRFAQYADGPAKVALAQELLGRSGRELIPLLNQGSLGVKKLTEEARALGLVFGNDQLKQAADYKDNLDRLSVASKAFGISMANAVLPTLVNVTDAMVQGAKEGGMLLAIWRGLVEVMAKPLGYDALSKAVSKADDLNREILRLGDQIDQQRQILDRDPDNQMATRRLNSLRAKLGAVQQEAIAAAEAVKRVVDPQRDVDGSYAAAEAKRLGQRGKRQAPILDDKNAKAANKELQEQAKLLAELAGLTPTFAEDWDRLSRMFASGKLTLQQLTEEQKKLLDKQPGIKKAREDEAKMNKAWAESFQQVEDEANAAYAADGQARDRVSIAITEQTRALNENADTLRLERSLMGATAKERDTALGQYKIELQLKKELDELNRNLAFSEEQREVERKRLMENAGLAKQLVAVRAEMDEQQKLWDDIDNTARDVWRNIGQGGQDLWHKLKDSGKAIFWDWLYQMTARKWLLNVQGTFTSTGASAGGVAEQAAAAGGGLNPISSAVSLFSGGSMTAGLGSMISGIGSGTAIGGLFQGAGATLTNGLVSGFSANMANIGTLASGGQFLGALGAAAPYLAVAAVLVSALMKKGGGPKADGRYGVGLQSGIGAKDNSLVGSVQPAVDALNSQYAAMAKQLGVSDDVKFGLAISRDPKGTSPTFLEVGATKNGQQLFSNLNRNVGRSDEDLQQAVAVATVDAWIGALKSADVKGPLGEALRSVGDDASMAVKQGILDRITKAMNERAALEAQIFDLTATDLEKLNKQRDQERAAIDESNKALLEQVYALQDQKKAAEEATAYTESFHQALRDQVSQTEQALREGYEREAGALRDTIAARRSYAKDLRAERDALLLGDQSPLQSGGRMDAAQRAYDELLAKAMAGDQEAQAAFSGAARAVLTAAQQSATSGQQYATTFAKVREDMRMLANAADASADVDQLQLNALTAQISTLISIETATKTTAQLMAELVGARSAAEKSGVKAPTTAESLYAARGASGDAEGMAYWAARLASGESAASVQAAFNASFDWVQANQHAGGLDRVPFDNYPALLHKDETVLNRAEANVRRSERKAENAATESQLVTLMRDVRSVQVSMLATLQAMNARWKQFDVDGLPPTRVA